MIIALDYDGTYTADPELWLEFIKRAHERGHKVYCITMRWEGESGSMDPRLTSAVEVIFTARQAKKSYARKMGIEPNIWIEDVPEWLFEDAL